MQSMSEVCLVSCINLLSTSFLRSLVVVGYQQTGYKMDKLEIVNATYRQVLATRGTPSHMPQDVMNIKIEASYQTNSRLRVKIYDPHNERLFHVG